MRNPDRHNSPLVSPDYLQGKQAGGKERKNHQKRLLWPLAGRPIDREDRSDDYIKGFAKSYYWDTEDLSMSDKVDVVVRMGREEYKAIDWSMIDRAAALLEGVRRLQVQTFSRSGEAPRSNL
jgi:hypothetical protein